MEKKPPWTEKKFTKLSCDWFVNFCCLFYKNLALHRSEKTIFLTRAFYINNVLLFSCPSPPQLNNRHLERKWCRSPVDRVTPHWRKQHTGVAPGFCSLSRGLQELLTVWQCKAEWRCGPCQLQFLIHTYLSICILRQRQIWILKEMRRKNGPWASGFIALMCITVLIKPWSPMVILRPFLALHSGERSLWEEEGDHPLTGHLDRAHEIT